MANISLLDSRIIERKISELTPHKTNARTHSAEQIEQIAASIETFGFLNPVLIDGDGRVIAGHGRIEAAKKLRRKSVPTLSIEGMSEADRRAYIIADNRLAELAGWDDDLLKLEFEYQLEFNSSFDFELIGFSETDANKLLDADAADDHGNDVPQVDNGPPVSAPGDLWLLGDHRLICGDARETDVYQRLLGGEAAQMVFTDPPYNVPIDGHVCGLGSVKHDEFAMAAGEMSREQFTGFLSDIFGQLVRFSQDGSIHYVCMDWRHMAEILEAGEAHFAELKNLIVWNKDNGGMGNFYRSKHELIFAFKNGTAKHINNFGLGDTGRYRTNVWDYQGANSMRKARAEELAMHPTVKPVELMADAMLDCSKRGGIVLDCFGGSGSTLIAAEKTARKARLIEIDPKYCDVIVKRWQELTGKQAMHAGLDLPFDEIASG
jgi:DNA modification methylase